MLNAKIRSLACFVCCAKGRSRLPKHLSCILLLVSCTLVWPFPAVKDGIYVSNQIFAVNHELKSLFTSHYISSFPSFPLQGCLRWSRHTSATWAGHWATSGATRRWWCCNMPPTAHAPCCGASAPTLFAKESPAEAALLRRLLAARPATTARQRPRPAEAASILAAARALARCRARAPRCGGSSASRPSAPAGRLWRRI